MIISSSDLLLAIITIAIGASISIILEFYFQERRSLSYWIVSRKVFSDQNTLSDVDFRSKGKRLVYLFSHTIFMWNSGNTALRLENFENDDPIYVRFKEGSIIELSNLLKTSNFIRCDIKADANYFFPNINLLDSGCGIVVSILETVNENGYGKWSKSPAEIIRVEGSVIDLNRKIKNIPISNLNFFRLNEKFSNISWLTLSIAIGVSALLSLFSQELSIIDNWKYFALLSILTFVFPLALWGYAFWGVRRHHVPKMFFDWDWELANGIDPLNVATEQSVTKRDFRQ